jgi:hypothetical protein
MERMWKEAVVINSGYYPGIYLEERGKLQKPRSG